jgi:sulfatase modifying factor 1
MAFILLLGGTFRMGSENGEEFQKPVHKVKVGGFLISKYEVTQAVWQKVMGNNPSEFKGDNNPVEQVSWDDCQEFCKKTGLRLPTEAEWEYACRAGTTTKYYWGNEPDEAYMWYNENSGNTTHAVGQKKANGYGLYDMSGNVWEWCQDWYGAYAINSQENPTGPDNGEVHVLRGGSWDFYDTYCRSSNRGKSVPTRRSCNYGFRCVQDLSK